LSRTSARRALLANAPRPDGLETSMYSERAFLSAGSGTERYKQRAFASLQDQFGVVYLRGRAPHGTYGYGIFRTVDGTVQLLCATSPVFGHEVPVAWACGADAHQIATTLGGKARYLGSIGIDATRYVGALRFANKGEVVLRLPHLPLAQSMAAALESES